MRNSLPIAIALGLAMLAAMVLAVQLEDANDRAPSDRVVALASDSEADDGRPPGPGPNNPNGPSY